MQAQVLVGPADAIAAHVAELRTQTGVDFDFVARSYFQTMSFAQQTELLERLAPEVAPLV